MAARAGNFVAEMWPVQKFLRTAIEWINPQGSPIFLAGMIGFLLATIASVWLRY